MRTIGAFILLLLISKISIAQIDSVYKRGINDRLGGILFNKKFTDSSYHFKSYFLSDVVVNTDLSEFMVQEISLGFALELRKTLLVGSIRGRLFGINNDSWGYNQDANPYLQIEFLGGRRLIGSKFFKLYLLAGAGFGAKDFAVQTKFGVEYPITPINSFRLGFFTRTAIKSNFGWTSWLGLSVQSSENYTSGGYQFGLGIYYIPKKFEKEVKLVSYVNTHHKFDWYIGAGIRKNFVNTIFDNGSYFKSPYHNFNGYVLMPEVGINLFGKVNISSTAYFWKMSTTQPTGPNYDDIKLNNSRLFIAEAALSYRIIGGKNNRLLFAGIYSQYREYSFDRGLALNRSHNADKVYDVFASSSKIIGAKLLYRRIYRNFHIDWYVIHPLYNHLKKEYAIERYSNNGKLIYSSYEKHEYGVNIIKSERDVFLLEIGAQICIDFPFSKGK